MDERSSVARLLREQAGWCRTLGSRLYGELLDRAALDVVHGGPCWTVLRDEVTDQGEKRGSALALRFMGSVHRLVLEGRAPALAAHYPSAGGEPGSDQDAWAAFRHTVQEHSGMLPAQVHRRCQTNEVGRSAALVGGFLLVAGETRLPLRILEIGASAGLNLRWDGYRFEAGSRGWGDPDSPVRFHDVYEGERIPPFATPATVVERAGCDLHPVDPRTEEGRIALKSFVWADQLHRFHLLEGALQVSKEVPASVDEADAVDWLESRMTGASEDRATVIFHSVVMDQMPLETRTRIRSVIEEAGSRASPSAPLAWLRMEGSYSYALLRFLPHEVWLTTWPGGEERRVAHTGAHGKPVRWLV